MSFTVVDFCTLILLRSPCSLIWRRRLDCREPVVREYVLIDLLGVVLESDDPFGPLNRMIMSVLSHSFFLPHGVLVGRHMGIDINWVTSSCDNLHRQKLHDHTPYLSLGVEAALSGQLSGHRDIFRRVSVIVTISALSKSISQGFQCVPFIEFDNHNSRIQIGRTVWIKSQQVMFTDE